MTSSELNNAIEADPLKSVSASLQEEIETLYKGVAAEIEALVSCHLEPLSNHASKGTSYRRIQPLLTELGSIQSKLLAIQAFQRVKDSVSIEINHFLPVATGKEWIYLEGEDCPYCADDIQIEVKAGTTDFYDEDHIRCTECKFESPICADEDGYWIGEVDKTEEE
jgi:hypothetical protein